MINLKRIFRRARPECGNRFYSLEGEDIVLSSILTANGIKVNEGGSYVDVGAHDPIRYSNTLYFHEKGWRGLNIDVNLEAEMRFQSERPEDRFLLTGVSDHEGRAKFYRYNDLALNGIDNDRSIELKDTPYRLESVDEIRVRTLSSILNEFFPEGLKGPSFLNVDVEGHEESVLSGNDWDKYRFDYIVIEQRQSSLGEILETEVYRVLSNIGYRAVASTGRTVIYSS